MEENFIVTERLLERDAKSMVISDKVISKLVSHFLAGPRFPMGATTPYLTFDGELSLEEKEGGGFVTSKDMQLHLAVGVSKMKMIVETETKPDFLIFSFFRDLRGHGGFGDYLRNQAKVNSIVLLKMFVKHHYTGRIEYFKPEVKEEEEE